MSFLTLISAKIIKTRCITNLEPVGNYATRIVFSDGHSTGLYAWNYLLKLVGVEPAAGHELVHSVEELKMLVKESTEIGVVEDEESEMLHAIFDFGDRLVRQVMIPRTEIMAFEADLTLNESIEMAVKSTFTTFPVFDDVLDNVIGVVHIKDLLRAQLDPKQRNCLARDLIREALFIPETVRVAGVLQRFRALPDQMASGLYLCPCGSICRLLEWRELA